MIRGDTRSSLQTRATRWVQIVVAAAGYMPVGVSMSLDRGRTSGSCSIARRRSAASCGISRAGRSTGPGLPSIATLPCGSLAEIYASPNSERVIATTDEKGRWRSDALPAGMPAEAQFGVLVTHPDHITVASLSTAQEARAFSSLQVMKPGVSISGTVLSPFGRPVRDATVVVARAPWDTEFLRLKTDKNGQFRSAHCFDSDRTELVMLVQATGLAWSVHHVAMKREIPPQVIRLTRRRPLEGRVVDAKGQPVAVLSS